MAQKRNSSSSSATLPAKPSRKRPSSAPKAKAPAAKAQAAKATAAKSGTTRARRDVQVRTSGIGRGVFALQAFETEVMISEIKGRVIHDLDYSSDTCMDLGDGMTLEAFAPFRFLNHSCEPNCELVVMDELDEDDKFLRRYMAVYSLRDLEIGEELTIDYAWSSDAAIRCRCRSASCRGWVVSKDELHIVTKQAAKKRKKTPRLLK